MSIPKSLIAFILIAVAVQGQMIPSLSTSFPTGSSLLNQYLASSSPSQTCCSDQTITVSGSATIQAPPDTATLTVQITVNGDTVNSAIALLTTKINSVISILTCNGLNSSNYQASSLSVYPNTSYADGVQTILGQIATESLSIRIPVINSNGSNIGKLVDSLAAVNGIILNGLSFDVLDKTSEFAEARGKAFANAQRKAQDYTSALQLCLGQVVTITDSYSVSPVVKPSLPSMQAFSNSLDKTPTNVNVGTVPISYYVDVVYSFG